MVKKMKKTIDKEKLIKAIGKFADKRLAIVGDAFLDLSSIGTIERINPEKIGTPLLKIQREEYRLGGAGNVAMNIRSLGAHASLNCIIGEDPKGNILKGLCENNNIRLFSIRRGESIIKKRFVESEENQYILRADYGENDLWAIDEKSAKHLYEHLDRARFDAIVISDYNKHMFKGDFGKQLIEMAEKRDVMSIVDAKPVNAYSFKHATLISPNLKEAREILGTNILNERVLTEELKNRIKSYYVIITLAERGMACYDGKNYDEIPTKAREVIDVCGAGDTARAAIALGLVSGLNLVEAAHLGNYAAGIVVEKQGTSVVDRNELIERIRSEGN